MCSNIDVIFVMGENLYQLILVLILASITEYYINNISEYNRLLY